MKRLVFGIILAIFLLSASLVSAQSVLPKGVENGKNVVLDKDQVVDRDYFASGDTVTISGTVNGDAYIAAGQIIINGTINGDLLAAGGTLNISGDITQNARIAGGNITIDGKIGRNLTVGGGNVNLTKSADVASSIVAGCGNLFLDAPVGGNIMAGAGTITVSNSVKGDLQAGVGQLTLTPSAQIGGDINYWSDNQATIDSGVKVTGKTTMHKTNIQVNQEELEKAKAGARGFATFLHFVGFVSSLVIGLIMIRLFPKYADSVVDKLKKQPWASLGIGFVTLVLTPIACIILLITLFGAPLAFITIALYLIYLYIAKLYFSYWLGGEIRRRVGSKMSSYWAFTLGLVVFSLVTLIPFFGGLVRFFALLFGLGAILMACSQYYKEAKKKALL